MLKLNLMDYKKEIWNEAYLNTSYVKVKPSGKVYDTVNSKFKYILC